MHGSLHKPMDDHATRTFVERCAELSLHVWAVDGQGVKPLGPTSELAERYGLRHEPALSESIAKRLEAIQQSERPIDIEAGRVAAWIADRDGPCDGFVLVSARHDDREPTTASDLAPAMKAMAWSLADLRAADQSQYAVDDLAEQLGQSYENITLLYGIGKSMRSTDAPLELAQGICDQIRLTQGFGWAAVRFIEDEQDVSGLQDACLVTGDMAFDPDAFRKMTARMIETTSEADWSKLLQVGQHELADLVHSEVILEPIRHDNRIIGLVLAGGKTGPDAEATAGDIQLLDAIAGFLGAMHENSARFVEQKNMFIGSLEAVSTALDAKDRYTHGHSERVAWLGTRLAEAIGLGPDEVERIRISGLVHDVGKIGVPEAVLCKTGRLNDQEFEQIKKHPRIGYNILKGIPKIEDVLDGVLYHHERWDGRGYPTRLAGEAIPLYGRILAIADTFDAMSSTRSYRKAMDRDRVLTEIADCSGTQFDPALTGPFIAIDFSEYDEMVERHQGASASDAHDLAA